MMMRRSSPLLVSLALLLLVSFSHHYAAAARLLRPTTVPALVHQDGGVGEKAAPADGVALEEAGSTESNGDDVTEAACEEGNEECMQRRLLHDAHLDYIYTQHKGKP